MKVLITGATGLIGKELVQLLLKNNYSVNYLTTSREKIVKTQNYNGYFWNINSNEIDKDCIQDVEVIIHLAGSSISKRWTKSYKQEILASRTKSAQLLYNTLTNNSNNVKYIITASGTAIYPETTGEIIDENMEKVEKSYLSEVVQQWENSVSQFKNLGIKTTFLRTGVVFAKNDGAFPQMVKPIKLGFGSVLGHGNQMISWVHVTDIVNIYLFCLENKLEGVFNAVSPQPVSNRVFTKAVALKLNKLLWLPNAPFFILKLVLGEMSYLLINSKNLSSKKIEKQGFVFHYPTLSSALNNLL